MKKIIQLISKKGMIFFLVNYLIKNLNNKINKNDNIKMKPRKMIEKN